jgi:hypothetical protein
MRWKYNCCNYQEIAPHGQPGGLPLPQVREKEQGQFSEPTVAACTPPHSGHLPDTVPKPQVHLSPPMAETNSPYQR